MTVKEFNEWHEREYNNALSFINNIDHAIEKAGDESKYQMECIGWGNNVKQTLLNALNLLLLAKRGLINKDGEQDG